MKKLFSLFALTSLLFASSCSEDAIMESANSGEATVTFSAELPNSINSRAYSDGTTAKHLDYAVYVSGKEGDPQITGSTTFDDNLKATVSLTLATGVSYDFIFWATDGNKAGTEEDPDDGAYEVDWVAKTMTVDYNKLKANDESNDAFYHYEGALHVQGAVTKPIKLYRPFAQINLGTDDFDEATAAGLTVDSSSMVMTDVPNVLNFKEGTVSGNATVTLAKNEFTTTEAFPVTGYQYLEMNYVLAGAQKSASHTCTFSIYKEGATVALNPDVVVSNVPVQRNFRTNIYGSLLTDPATFNVEIVPDYETPDYNVDTSIVVEDLSETETANCYIVSVAGHYKFKTVKGNSAESVGDVVSTEILWESFGTNDAINKNDLIKSASYSDGYITFATADTYKEGNALIAAKDANGEILWSWHIWMTDKPSDQDYIGTNKGAIMMDRNLGATEANPTINGVAPTVGLLYQWGRKDPFIGWNGGNNISDMLAKNTMNITSYNNTNNKGNGQQTLDWTIKNPTKFAAAGYNICISDSNYEGWTAEKSIYDPCPPGYKVPNEIWSDRWASAGNHQSFNGPEASKDSSLNLYWFTMTSCYYPLAKELSPVGSMSDATYGYYWSQEFPDPDYVFYMQLETTGRANIMSGNDMANGRSIRCQKIK